MLRQLLSLASLALIAPAAQAQITACFAPDNLAGPCCTPTGANLPAFPPISLPASAIAWNSCALAGTACATLDLSPPLPGVVCGQFGVQIRVNDCLGNTHLVGKGILDYARTWIETGNISVAPTVPPLPANYQVWRFLIKLDLQANPSPVAPSGLLFPADLAINNTVFYYGHVDYALDCNTGQFKTSVVLFHGADWLINFPGISSNNAGANPTRSYALVAPNTPINPFVPALSLITPAPVAFESVRAIGNINQPGTPALCNSEENLAQGFYNPLAFGCLNPPALGPVNSAAVQLQGASQCGSNFQSINLFGTVPWLELISTSLGSWTTGNDYPGPEAVRADEGLFAYRDACQAGTVGNGQALEIFYGTESQGGFGAFLVDPTGVLVGHKNFIDLVSNWRRPVGTPLMLPAIGRVMQSYHLISVNPQ
jgi:hypothetical protein